MSRKKQSRFSETGFLLIRNWYGSLFGIIGVAAVAMGLFEPDSNVLLQIIVVGLLIFASCRDLYPRLQGKISDRYLDAVTGPLLWTILIWILFRRLVPFAEHALFLPACFAAWLYVSFPIKQLILPTMAAVFMEIGLFAADAQSIIVLVLNLIFYTAAITALSLFTDSKAYRRRMRQSLARSKAQAETDEYALDFALMGDTPSLLNSLNLTEDLDKPQNSRPAVEAVTASFNLQLELLRKALGLTTVAILSLDPTGSELRLRNLTTSRKDIFSGPYPGQGGFVSALKSAGSEVALAPAKGGSWSLPYYKNQQGVGSLFALRVEDDLAPDDENQSPKITAILCVDRTSDDSWTETERNVLRTAARKFSLELSMNRKMLTLDKEKSAMQRVCVGLRELNSVLGLEHVFDATFTVIRTLVDADCIAISLRNKDKHRVVRAEGLLAEQFQDLEKSATEGLVGQAFKLQRTVPLTAEYRGPAPIFSNDEKISEFRSLLIMPLLKEEGEVIGALIVAACRPGVFTKHRRDMLELIAAQIAIKIDLGQAHEKINTMASTDGLTGLANHRTFQHGFVIMLERARRQKTPLCLILCDIDFFKKVNDTYGHPFGDQVLMAVARILSETVRTVDLAARYGGEEFAIVLEGSDQEGGRLMAERIRNAIEEMTVRHEGQTANVTLSLGLTVFPVFSEEKSTLISQADQALYRAKNLGRNQVVCWSELNR
ncbi:MAG: sensor domain-containing diguanylate cyclase [Proteobacteria bacterium]|nr:sensor domain-containing diguanylate cyclase [Pseudomonadota bacterium]MBU1710301.1 sensor domain-containing diguanylate cyclase [Pseudomonadota bacterium]